MEKCSSEFVTSGSLFGVVGNKLFDGVFGEISLRYWMSSSSSELPSIRHISSSVSSSWRRIRFSKQLVFSLWYDRFFADCLVSILVSSVIDFLPKCASNGVTLRVLSGMRRMFSIMFDILELSVSELQLGSTSSTAKWRFTVCISLSTISVPLWSPAGASISLIFIFLEKNFIFFCFKGLCLIASYLPWYTLCTAITF